jgi:hypothetical protein
VKFYSNLYDLILLRQPHHCLLLLNYKIVNSNKLMLEINLQADGYFSLFFMVKKLCLHKTGLQNNYSLSTQSIASLFKILGQLRYCQGLSSVDKNLPMVDSDATKSTDLQM